MDIKEQKMMNVGRYTDVDDENNFRSSTEAFTNYGGMRAIYVKLLKVDQVSELQ